MTRPLRRGALLNLPRVALAAGAVAAIGAATVIAVCVLHPSRPVSRLIAQPAPVPLSPEERRLARCQRLGEAGARDAECLRIWAEMRERFLSADPHPPAAPPPLSAARED